MSGGSHVLVDQAAQDRFSADLESVEVPCRDAGRMVFSVGSVIHKLLFLHSFLSCSGFDCPHIHRLACELRESLDMATVPALGSRVYETTKTEGGTVELRGSHRAERRATAHADRPLRRAGRRCGPAWRQAARDRAAQVGRASGAPDAP